MRYQRSCDAKSITFAHPGQQTDATSGARAVPVANRFVIHSGVISSIWLHNGHSAQFSCYSPGYDEPSFPHRYLRSISISFDGREMIGGMTQGSNYRNLANFYHDDDTGDELFFGIFAVDYHDDMMSEHCHWVRAMVRYLFSGKPATARSADQLAECSLQLELSSVGQRYAR
jgi:hypothetical protein